MDNKLEDVTKEEAKDTAVKDGQTEKEYKEITLKFGKGCVGDEFQGKDGNTYRQIMIPPNEEVKQPWQTFVVKANQVHENQYGKGLWAKIPADGSTVVTKPSLQGQDDKAKNIWQDVKTQVPNTEPKAMVKSYKTRAPQAKETQPRESAREKLDALVKDTAAKVASEKPKAKAKSKKGPEL